MSPQAEDHEEHDPYDDEDGQDEGPAPTPFDHPLFLPGLLFAFTLWFGYDGFFNQEMAEKGYKGFNQGGFALFGLLTLWFGYKGFQEMREDREGPDDPGGG